MSDFSPQQAFDGRPYPVYDRMQIARLILNRPLQLLQGRFNGAALRMAKHHHQASTEFFGGELHAADQGRSNDVTGDTNDEQVAQALIEDDLHGYTRI